MKKVILIGISCLLMGAIEMCAAQEMESASDKTARIEQEKIEVARKQAKEVIDTAQDVINEIRKKELLGTISRSEAERRIRRQNDSIADAEKALAKILKKSITVVESALEEEGYFSYLVSQAKDMGAQVVSLAKSGQVFTEKEKRLARREIKRLREQEEKLLKDYEDALASASNVRQRTVLENRYEVIVAEINGRIHEQQVVAGEAMSHEMKLFWSTVGAGALIAGKYFAGTRTPITPSVSAPEPVHITKTPGESAQERDAWIDTQAEILRREAEVRVLGEEEGYRRAKREEMATEKKNEQTLVQLQAPASTLALTPAPTPVPEKKILTPEEREVIKKNAQANFLWTLIAGANAVLLVDLAFAASPLMMILNPSVGFAGIAAASGAAGIKKVIQLMSEK